MSQVVFKMPDLGEGTVEAEIVAWRTHPGATVKEDDILVEVMTDKAAVEVPSPVSGRVVSVSGEPGDKVAVGAPLVVFETGAPAGAPSPSPSPSPVAGTGGAGTGGAGTGGAAARSASPPMPSGAPTGTPAGATQAAAAMTTGAATGSARVRASPANRRRAREAGIDLRQLQGSGPGGRIVSADLAAAAAGSAAPREQGPAALAGAPGTRAPAPPPTTEPGSPQADRTEIKVIGLRRVIAERMSEAKRTIPHFAYVEEVDVTELETLRRHLNASLERPATGGAPGAAPPTPPLTYLPFIIIALTRVLKEFPQCNATYDAARGVLIRHRPVHVGIATQTPDGLKVPVVRDAQSLDLWQLARAIASLSERARQSKSSREELSGSTITVTSLGKLGGIVSTPVINLPEVAIIGINKAIERPVVREGAVVVRRMMNLSSSFDHRFVDGYDAAAMIQKLKERLEIPATLFIPDDPLPKVLT
jgi:2-oxoisovalerate dehydrogenase E2 component (dihydrolipoyl transacylase)